MPDKEKNENGTNGGFHFDMTGWRMREVKAFIKANKEVDIDAIENILLTCLKSWPFAAAIAKESFDDLTIPEWRELQEAATAAFQEVNKR